MTSPVVPDEPGVWRFPRRPTVTLDAVEYGITLTAARSWWWLWDAGPETVLRHLFDESFFRRLKAISHDISGAARWGELGPSYATLQRLRDTPAWVRRCRRPVCSRTDSVATREQWSEPWWCPDHAAEGKSSVISAPGRLGTLDDGQPKDVIGE